MLQLYARKYQVPVNALGFEFTVLPMGANDITDSPSDGVYVHGLWLEGAKWNAPSRTLMDPEPGEMFAVSCASLCVFISLPLLICVVVLSMHDHSKCLPFISCHTWRI